MTIRDLVLKLQRRTWVTDALENGWVPPPDFFKRTLK